MPQNERLAVMLDYIVKTMSSDDDENALFELIRPVYEAAVRSTGRRIMEEYVTKHLANIQVPRAEEKAPDVCFAEILSVQAAPEETVKEPVTQAEKECQCAAKPVKPVKKKNNQYWHELIGYDIDFTKHKYTPIVGNSWAQEIGIYKGIELAALTRYMFKVSYEMALGVIKEPVKNPEHGRKTEHYCFPGEVYREVKRRYDMGELPPYLRGMINKAKNDKKQAEKRKEA